MKINLIEYFRETVLSNCLKIEIKKIYDKKYLKFNFARLK